MVMDLFIESIIGGMKKFHPSANKSFLLQINQFDQYGSRIVEIHINSIFVIR